MLVYLLTATLIHLAGNIRPRQAMCSFFLSAHSHVRGANEREWKKLNGNITVATAMMLMLMTTPFDFRKARFAEADYCTTKVEVT